MTLRSGPRPSGLQEALIVVAALCACMAISACGDSGRPSAKGAAIRDSALGRGRMVGNVSWSDGLLLWDEQDDDGSNVCVWDSRTDAVRQLEPLTAEPSGVSGSFLYRDRAYWLRTGRATTLVSAPVGGGEVRTELSRPGARIHVTAAGGRLAWSEREHAARGLTLFTKRVFGERVERIAHVESPGLDVAVSEGLLAWVERNDEAPPSVGQEIHVIAIDSRGRLGGTILHLPLSTQRAAAYLGGTLRADGDRIVWGSWESRFGGRVFTWLLGEESPTDLSALVHLRPDTYGEVVPALSDDVVAWGQRGRIVVWKDGRRNTRVLSPRPGRAIGAVAAGGGKIVWLQRGAGVRSGDAQTDVVVEDLASGVRREMPARGAEIDADGRNTLSIWGRYVTYEGASLHDSDVSQLRVLGPIEDLPLVE